MSLPPKRILCTTDFSVAGGAAVRRAGLVARDYGAHLALLHVVPASMWDDAAGRLGELAGLGALDPLQAQRDAALRLQRVADDTAAEIKRGCEALVRYGRPAAQIAAAAAESGADLLVIGAHGAHPVTDLVMGTTAQKLLRTAPCPVLIVKRPPPFDYGTVLLPTDFSGPASRAAAAARALLPHAMFHCVHAFELPYDGLMRHAGVDIAVVEHYRSAAEGELKARLAEVAEQLGAVPGRVFVHLRHGYAPTRIDEWIRELAADLVAIAAHGKSEIEATFLGSVSMHVAQSAPCDVLLLRGAGYA